MAGTSVRQVWLCPIGSVDPAHFHDDGVCACRRPTPGTCPGCGQTARINVHGLCPECGEDRERETVNREDHHEQER